MAVARKKSGMCRSDYKKKIRHMWGWPKQSRHVRERLEEENQACVGVAKTKQAYVGVVKTKQSCVGVVRRRK